MSEKQPGFAVSLHVDGRALATLTVGGRSGHPFEYSDFEGPGGLESAITGMLLYTALLTTQPPMDDKLSDVIEFLFHLHEELTESEGDIPF